MTPGLKRTGNTELSLDWRPRGPRVVPAGTTRAGRAPHFTRLPVMSMTFVSWPSLPAPSMYISKR